MKIRKKKGFTLMELLIVVAIIGVLVAIAIPVINGLVEKSRAAADDATMRAAQTAFAVQELTTGIKPGKRAIYDKKSNTFVERADYLEGKKSGLYKFYGQAYNEEGGMDQNGQISKGVNAHIYVDHLAEEGYGPEALVWWTANKKDNPELWG